MNGWVEADRNYQTSIVPAVLMEAKVDAMNNVLCHGIYSYFTSEPWLPGTNQHPQHSPKVQNNQNAIKKVPDRKKCCEDVETGEKKQQ